MNHPNPFIPQGSVLEQNKRRSRMKLAVFCVLAVGVCGLTAMLIQGCKREQSADNTPPIQPAPAMTDTNLQPATTNAAPVETNVAPIAPIAPVTPVAPVAPVVPAAAGTEYIVVKGDKLGTIAKNNHVTLKALEDANPGVVPTKLKVGQKLTIPAAGAAAPTTAGASAGADMNSGAEIYVVKPNDNLTKIASAHGTTVKAIQKENNLTTTRIKVGQKLKMPAKAEAAAPAVAPAPAPAPAPVAPVATPAPAGTPAGQ